MNKEITAAEVVAQLRDGMTLGIGGWGARRKPMGLGAAVLPSPPKGEPTPCEPYFRKARESGAIEVMELDEGMFEWGLRAAGMRMSFLPTRVGLATDVLAKN